MSTQTQDLAQKKCMPCAEGGQPLKGQELQELLRQVQGWELVEDRMIRRSFKLKNFREALDLVNQIGQVAEQEQHHPDIQLGWGKVVVELSTHKIKGLSENDFILAAKIDQLRK